MSRYRKNLQSARLKLVQASALAEDPTKESEISDLLGMAYNDWYAANGRSPYEEAARDLSLLAENLSSYYNPEDKDRTSSDVSKAISKILHTVNRLISDCKYQEESDEDTDNESDNEKKTSAARGLPSVPVSLMELAQAPSLQMMQPIPHVKQSPEEIKKEISGSKLIESKATDGWPELSFRLLTTLLYECKRYQWNDHPCSTLKNWLVKINGIYDLQEKPHDPNLARIHSILSSTESDQAQKNALSKLLEEIETANNTFYGSYLSDDSDNDEETKLDEKLMKERKYNAQKLLERVKDYEPVYKKKAGLKYTPSKTSLDKRRKIEYVGQAATDIKTHLDNINEKIQQGVALHEAIKTTPPIPLFVAQYRGIHYRTSEWGQTARRKHRKLDERNKPVYSASVYASLTPSQFSFNQFYKEKIDEKMESTLKEQAQRLKQGLIAARNASPVVYNDYTYNSIGHMLQDIYTRDYKKFFALIKNNNFGILINNNNPFVSTGNVPDHALRYAYGIKYYADGQDGEAKAERLRPQWVDGQPQRFHSGKVYITLHPLSDFGTMGPLDVIRLNREAKTVVINNIVYEAERSFPAYVEENRVIDQHIAKYPSFKGAYKNIYYYKYGLTQDLYEKFKNVIQTARPHSTELKKAKKILGEWLCVYHEVRLIEIAKQTAESRGGFLVYLKQDGTLGLEPDSNSDIGISPNQKNDLSNQEILRRREFRTWIAQLTNNRNPNDARQLERKSVEEQVKRYLDEIFESSQVDAKSSPLHKQTPPPSPTRKLEFNSPDRKIDDKSPAQASSPASSDSFVAAMTNISLSEVKRHKRPTLSIPSSALFKPQTKRVLRRSSTAPAFTSSSTPATDVFAKTPSEILAQAEKNPKATDALSKQEKLTTALRNGNFPQADSLMKQLVADNETARASYCLRVVIDELQKELSDVNAKHEREQEQSRGETITFNFLSGDAGDQAQAFADCMNMSSLSRYTSGSVESKKTDDIFRRRVARVESWISEYRQRLSQLDQPMAYATTEPPAAAASSLALRR